MNIFGIFLESSITAQIIMALLSIFSIWSWAIFFRKLYDFAKMRKLVDRFLSTYRFHQNIKELENMGPLLNDNPFGRVLHNGIKEYKKLKKSKNVFGPGKDSQTESAQRIDELSDNMRLVMEKTKITEIRQFAASLPMLSTIVSVSPFLGLLGTVWGVMKAFLDIRTRGSAHITIVAPGISDALITTVYGLIVAIPALIFYNIVRSRVNNFEDDLTKFIYEVFVRLRENLLLNHE